MRPIVLNDVHARGRYAPLAKIALGNKEPSRGESVH
jgi:hypothetical protein